MLMQALNDFGKELCRGKAPPLKLLFRFNRRIRKEMMTYLGQGKLLEYFGLESEETVRRKSNR